MIQVITSDGEVFEIDWIGVSSIDGVLRFCVINDTLARILQIFMDPQKCSVLTRKFDEDEKTFEGYVVFRGVTINYDESVIVALSKI